MYAQTWIRWISILLIAGLAACSGSGSSGFDISPDAENLAISQALDQMQCQELESLTICPSDEPAPPSSPSDMPTPGESLVQIQTGFDGATPLRCTSANGECVVDVFFSATGFAPETEFRVAARRVEPSDSWRVTGAPERFGSAEMPSFLASVALPADTQEAQIAVLVFVETTPIAAGTLETLTSSGADIAFVGAPTPIVP